MIGIPIALVVSNAAEWVVHKYVLHGLGANKRSFWAFHWHEHHRASRGEGFFDADYERFPLGWHAQGKEILALVGMGVATAPLFGVAPWFVLTSYYCSYRYYRLHKRAHLDPAWAREHLPWHYDHHMGPNQHANWCVTRPWFDGIMGTREPYAGTERERRDREKRPTRMRARSTTAEPIESRDPGPGRSPDPARPRRDPRTSRRGS
jgi:sterol desaturase/sphingolipid hydroxylase (fatty acid hydroxylase superfamily)